MSPCLLLMVGNHVIVLNPNSPHGNAPKEVPNSKPSFVFLPDAMSKNAILPIKIMERVVLGIVKFKEDL